MSKYAVKFGDKSSASIGLTMVGVRSHGEELRVPVIRCRDCMSWLKGYCHKHAYEVTNEYGDAFTEGVFPMGEDGFCSLGVMRDER